MPVEHTVKQGETLSRIGQQYGFTANKLYEDANNQALRDLRPDPNVLFPGDKVHIPDKTAEGLALQEGMNRFVLIGGADTFRLLLKNPEGEVLSLNKAVLVVGGKRVDALIDADGVISCPLPMGPLDEAFLELWMGNQEQPDEIVDIKLGHLDPFDTLSGVQSRCNALGFDCGVVDGILGSKTREGVRAFQVAYGSTADGDPGPITEEKLKDAYGC